jgi:hypothetical protein
MTNEIAESKIIFTVTYGRIELKPFQARIVRRDADGAWGLLYDTGAAIYFPSSDAEMREG